LIAWVLAFFRPAPTLKQRLLAVHLSATTPALRRR
jgi:hypothetical protein